MGKMEIECASVNIKGREKTILLVELVDIDPYSLTIKSNELRELIHKTDPHKFKRYIMSLFE